MSDLVGNPEDWFSHNEAQIAHNCFRLMFGMMLPAWFLSMWLNNMATTAMMCPIADALLKELEHSEEDTSERKSRTQNSRLTVS